MLLLLCCSAPSWPQWKCSRNAPVKGCRSALWWEHDSGHLARYRAFWPIRLTTNLFKRFAIIQSQQHRYRTTRQAPQALAYLFIHWDIFSLALKQGSICVCVCVYLHAHTRPVSKTTLVVSEPIPRPVPVEFKSIPGLKWAKPENRAAYEYRDRGVVNLKPFLPNAKHYHCVPNRWAKTK